MSLEFNADGALFAGLGLADVSADPWAVADGTHKFIFSEVPDVKPTAKGDKIGITFKYDITEGPEAGKTHTEWMQIPQAADMSSDGVRARSFLRARLESLGIPESKFETMQRTDLLNIEGWITIETAKNDPTRKYVKKVSLSAPAEGTTSPSPAVATASANMFG